MGERAITIPAGALVAALAVGAASALAEPVAPPPPFWGGAVLANHPVSCSDPAPPTSLPDMVAGRGRDRPIVVGTIVGLVPDVVIPAAAWPAGLDPGEHLRWHPAAVLRVQDVPAGDLPDEHQRYITVKLPGHLHPGLALEEAEAAARSSGPGLWLLDDLAAGWSGSNPHGDGWYQAFGVVAAGGPGRLQVELDLHCGEAENVVVQAGATTIDALAAAIRESGS